MSSGTELVVTGEVVVGQFEVTAPGDADGVGVGVGVPSRHTGCSSSFRLKISDELLGEAVGVGDDDAETVVVGATVGHPPALIVEGKLVSFLWARGLTFASASDVHRQRSKSHQEQHCEIATHSDLLTVNS